MLNLTFVAHKRTSQYLLRLTLSARVLAVVQEVIPHYAIFWQSTGTGLNILNQYCAPIDSLSDHTTFFRSSTETYLAEKYL